MSVLDPDKTLRNLKKKGFQEAKTKSSDHKQLEFYHNGKLVSRTKISHNSEDLNPHLIKQMSVQC
jgi:predicted RNA binding protein YcfA (HicA-like mRNA interferase family)